MADTKQRALTVNQKAAVMLKNETVINALKNVLPRSMGIDRFVSIAAAEIKSPSLARVQHPASIIKCVFDAAKLGLDFNKNLGEAYIVPFKNKGVTMAQFIPGYRGLIKLARNGGVKDIHAIMCHEKDEWHYEEGISGADFSHKANYRNPGHLEAVVVRVTYDDGAVLLKMVPWYKLDSVMRMAKGRAPTGPWKTHEEDMLKKTAIRQVCKLLPQTTELAMAIAADESLETGKTDYNADADDALKEAGVIDAEYEELQAQMSEHHAESTKPDVELPKKKKRSSQDSDGTTATTSQKFISSIKDITDNLQPPMTDEQINAELEAEFSISSLAEVKESDMKAVYEHFKEKLNT